jgi:Protein of unknown function (DUF732)
VILRRTLAAIGITGGAVLTAASAFASPADDQGFLSALDKQRITYPSPGWAITTGRYVCTLLDDGANGVSAAGEISTTNGIPIENAGYFVGASIAAYCPWHAGAFGPRPG